MGRTKKPAAVHKRQGTYRKDRHASPNLPVVIPPMPCDLSPIAQAQWHIITRQLEAVGLIAEIDGTILRVFVESIAHYIEANDDIRERGMIVQDAIGNKRLNPSHRAARDMAAQIERFAKQFGMTPVSRTGLDFGQAGNDADDELEAIIGFKVSG